MKNSKTTDSQPILVAIITTVIGGYCAVGLLTIGGSYVKDNLDAILSWRPQWLSNPGESPLEPRADDFPKTHRASSSLSSILDTEDGVTREDSVVIEDLESGRASDAAFGEVENEEPQVIFLEEPPKTGLQDAYGLHWIFRQRPNDRPPSRQTSQRQSGEGAKPRPKPAASRAQSGNVQVLPTPKVGDSSSYIAGLATVTKSSPIELGNLNDADNLFSGEFGAKILHMRISHSGHWLVICHREACIVYDIEVYMPPTSSSYSFERLTLFFHRREREEGSFCARNIWVPNMLLKLLTMLHGHRNPLMTWNPAPFCSLGHPKD